MIRYCHVCSTKQLIQDYHASRKQQLGNEANTLLTVGFLCWFAASGRSYWMLHQDSPPAGFLLFNLPSFTRSSYISSAFKIA
mmetsp:Transcript_28868/g.35086  ORF Transcript_28868/g.35086 Transcript_28868/m.35086 type:complete len:82 (+) Transcript_28868:176-421(+)